MATELEGNEKLQRFIQLLCDLNHQAVEVLKSGNAEILFAMNDTVEEMYSIQHAGTEEAYTAIEEDMQVIYQNFNAVVTMIKSNEKVFADAATSVAVKKFLKNIFDANVRVVLAYGLA
ncbi:MAG: hypothetical protein J6K50_03885 [Clostridia bacterium]|nr:hypothetical protein [Clostridia bacterium]